MRADHEPQSEGMQPSNDSEAWSSYHLPGLRPDYSGVHSTLLEASGPIGDPPSGSESPSCHFPDFDSPPETPTAPWWISVLKAGLAVLVIYMLVYLLTMSLMLGSPEP